MARHQDVADVFMRRYSTLKLDRSTISKTLKKSEHYLYLEEISTAGMVLTDDLVKLKGREFGNSLGISEDDLKFSNGWVANFKKRNSLHRYRFSGEVASAPLESLSDERIKLRQLLSQYEPENIYNADETGLFYRMLLHQTLARQSSHSTPEASNSHSMLEASNPHIDNIENNESDEISNPEDNDGGISNPEDDDGISNPKNNGDASEVEMEFEYQESENNLDDDEIAEIITDLSSSNDPEASQIAQAMEKYVQTVNEPIATEGLLENEEIITMVQAEENDQQQESDDDEEPPLPPVTTKEVYNAIQTVLRYEEQMNSESNLEPEELEFL
ncbi:17478_t:CDS:2 [Cetraspora pellucida]|uniref:17478_t:CDS:1 n=1 Tax=Cetraspora pellucida TaxID=1433469 RepID=A0ACA9JVP1_9GLOM|nr:17478_t:CDS:2 [Cetraspora pellucida]